MLVGSSTGSEAIRTPPSAQIGCRCPRQQLYLLLHNAGPSRRLLTFLLSQSYSFSNTETVEMALHSILMKPLPGMDETRKTKKLGTKKSLFHQYPLSTRQTVTKSLVYLSYSCKKQHSQKSRPLLKSGSLQQVLCCQIYFLGFSSLLLRTQRTNSRVSESLNCE